MDEEEYSPTYICCGFHVRKAAPALGIDLLQSFISAQGRARFSQVRSISLPVQNLGFKAVHCGVIKAHCLLLESDNESLQAFSLKASEGL